MEKGYKPGMKEIFEAGKGISKPLSKSMGHQTVIASSCRGLCAVFCDALGALQSSRRLKRTSLHMQKPINAQLFMSVPMMLDIVQPSLKGL